MSYILLVLLTFNWSCSSNGALKESPLFEVVEVQPNKWTSITKQNLLHLGQVYDLRPFLFTKIIHIQSKAVPRSHPVLTLNTRHAENPQKILSTFLHEQIHWWLLLNKDKLTKAVSELRKIYPKTPASYGKASSAYFELLAAYLEMKALSFYVGKKEARETLFSLMKKDKINPWVYYQILHKNYAVKRIAEKYKLLPPPLEEKG